MILFWFRRDLRIDDNCGLYHALKGKNKVLPIFIFDEDIVSKLPQKDRRIEMIFQALGGLSVAMKENRCTVGRFHGTPKAIFKQLILSWNFKRIFSSFKSR